MKLRSITQAFALSLGIACALGSPRGARAQAPQSAPSGYDALVDQATNELATGNWARARDLFAEAHQLSPNATTLRGLGIAELRLGHPERARELLTRALGSSVQPLSPALHADTEATLAQIPQGPSAATAPVAQAAPVAQSAPVTPSAPVAPPAQPAPPPPVAPSGAIGFAPPPAMPLPPTGYDAPEVPPDDLFDDPGQRNAVAASLAVSGILPLEGYAEKTRGFGLDVGVWIQLEHLVVEPRVGFHFDVADPNRGYFHLPFEVGTYAFLPFSQHALFVGPGVGLSGLFERIDVSHTVGSAVVAESHDTLRDNAAGLGLFGRLGFVLGRTSPVSVAPSVEYALTFADLARAAKEQAVRINVALLFGGGR